MLLATLAFVFGVPGVAFGYWLSSTPAASLRISAGTLPAGQAPVVTVDRRSVTVTVTPIGPAVDTFLIRRYGSDGAVAAELQCADRCLDPDVPDGQWSYTETPLLGSWRGPESIRGPLVTVDTTAPAPTISSAAATADRTPTLTGRAGRARGDASRVVVELLSGGRSLGRRTVPVRQGQWRLTVGPLTPQRSYTAVVRQQDSAGNEGQTRAGFVLDTVAPRVNLAPVHWPVLAGTAGAVAASARTSADATTVAVQLFSAGRLVTTLTAPRTGSHWSVSGAGLASGSYTARAVQRDAAGNVATSRSRAFSIDATAPTVSVSVPAYVNTAPILTGRAGSAHGDARTVVVAVATTQGKVRQRLRVPVTAGSWRAVLRPLPTNRQYQVTVSQTDAAGNQGRATAAFVLDIIAPKPDLAYSDGQLTGRAGSAAATDRASPDDPNVTLEFDRGTGSPSTLSVPVLNGRYSSAPPDLPAGTYLVVAVQRDGAGNIGRSRSIELTIPPATIPPTASIPPTSTPPATAPPAS